MPGSHPATTQSADSLKIGGSQERLATIRMVIEYRLGGINFSARSNVMQSPAEWFTTRPAGQANDRSNT